MLDNAGLMAARILDLNQVLSLSLSIVLRHRRLAMQVGITGPFYVKVRIENIWRTMPFIDLPDLFEYILEFGFPLVQDSDIVAPTGGVALDELIELPERDVSKVFNSNGNIMAEHFMSLLTML